MVVERAFHTFSKTLTNSFFSNSVHLTRSTGLSLRCIIITITNANHAFGENPNLSKNNYSQSHRTFFSDASHAKIFQILMKIRRAFVHFKIVLFTNV